jgi:hypothetical protein
VEIHSSGTSHLLPGVFHRIEDVSTRKKTAFQENFIALKLANKHFPQWAPQHSLTDWISDVGDAMTHILPLEAGKNLTSQMMSTQSGLVLLANPIPLSCECYCDGPFGSVFDMNCGCDNTSFEMVRQLVGDPTASPLFATSSSSKRLTLLCVCSPASPPPATRPSFDRSPQRGVYSMVLPPENCATVGKFDCQFIAVIHRTFSYRLSIGESRVNEEVDSVIVGETMRALGLNVAGHQRAAKEEHESELSSYLHSIVSPAVLRARQRPLTTKTERIRPTFEDNPFFDESEEELEAGNEEISHLDVNFSVAVGVKLTGDDQMAMGQIILVAAVGSIVPLRVSSLCAASQYSHQTCDACIRDSSSCWAPGRLKLFENGNGRCSSFSASISRQSGDDSLAFECRSAQDS